jgi:hypothetical protein
MDVQREQSLMTYFKEPLNMTCLDFTFKFNFIVLYHLSQLMNDGLSVRSAKSTPSKILKKIRELFLHVKDPHGMRILSP